MISLMIFIQLFAAGLFALYLYINHRYSYWSRRGVPGPRSIYPFGFTLAKTLTRPDEYELGNVRRFGPVYGVYTGTVPTLTVADPVLIKELLIRDFPQFSNRRQLQAYNPVWNKNMFNLDVDEWKRVRAICSPIFTSGKLKAMVPLMDRCIDNLVAYIDSKVDFQESGSKKSGFINVKKTLSAFSIDVIAATAFATETDASGVLNSKGKASEDKKTSDFVHYGTSILNVPPLKVAAALFLPRPLLTLLGISTFFSEASFEFLISLSRKIFRERQNSKSKPAIPDLIQLMAENYTTDQQLSSDSYHHLTAKMDEQEETETEIKSNGFSQESKSFGSNSSAKKRMLDEDEIIGQCVLFFFAGFETTAFTLTTALFELAHHPEMQERLYSELNSLSAFDKSEQYYDQLLNHTPYLEAVTKETLRKHPNVVRLERRVSAKGGATLEFAKNSIHLDKDVLVEVPIMAVHHNPLYYPEPERFNPERFMPENKDSLVPYTYLPFGAGPRNCLGMRFAYQEMKLCLARILRRYRFSLAPDTPAKLVYAKGAQLLVCEPFQLAVELR